MARRAASSNDAAGRKRTGKGGDHGIAGASDVGHLVGAVNGYVDCRLLRLEQRHAASAARDKDGLHAGAAEQRAACRLEHVEVVVDLDAERLFHFRLVRRAGGQPLEIEQPIAAIDHNRHVAARSTCFERAANRQRQVWGHQPGAVVGQQHGVALGECRRELAGEGVAHIVRQRPAGFAVDPHHLLLGRVDAAREDAGLHRRPVVPGADDLAGVDPLAEGGEQALALIVGADEAGEQRAGAERRDVVRGVAGAARHDFSRVVLQDEDRSLARDARHLAVDELVRDQVADDEHAPRGKGIDDRGEPRRAFCVGHSFEVRRRSSGDWRESSSQPQPGCPPPHPPACRQAASAPRRRRSRCAPARRAR